MDATNLITSLFQSAILPSLRVFVVAFVFLPVDNIDEPDAWHPVFLFGKRRRMPPEDRTLILPPKIELALEKLVLRFDATHPVVVQHGGTFLELFGEAAKPGVLHIDANGYPVLFESR